MGRIIGINEINMGSDLKKGLDAVKRGASVRDCIAATGIDMVKLGDDIMAKFMDACDDMVNDILKRHPSPITATNAEKGFMVAYHSMSELAEIQHLTEVIESTENGGK